jgi:hypothetical protein
VARGPKLNFPEFSGDDIEGLIRKTEKYFELVGVPNEDRVQIAVRYISGKAEFWWRGTGCNASTLPWHHFCRLASDRFNVVSEYDIVGQFHNLKQTGTVLDYVEKFEEMVSMVKRHNPSLTDNYFISSFISGLKDNIQYHVQCHKPTILSQAYWFAKRLEQSTPSYKKFTNFASTHQKVQKTEVKEPNATNLAELRAAGKCFKCREPWVPGHTKVCKAKQIYSVIVLNNEGQEEIAVVEDSADGVEQRDTTPPTIPIMQISLHAINGTSHRSNTFTLKVQMGKHWATTLVDTGSDASFINAKFAIKTNFSVSTVQTVKVAAANGNQMCSSTVILACPYSIQGHQFTSDLRLLEVEGYDIILGAD